MNFSRRARDAQSESEYRQNWRKTRRALAEYLAYVIGERFVQGTRNPVPIYATPDTIQALRTIGLNPRDYGIESNRPADERSVDALVQDLERIYRGRAYERDRSGRRRRRASARMRTGGRFTSRRFR